MKKTTRLMLVFSAILCLVCFTIPNRAAAETNEAVSVKEWMILGPFNTPLPAYSDEGPKKFQTTDLLGFEFIDPARLNPAVETSLETPEGSTLTWRRIKADSAGVTIGNDGDAVQTAYLAAYIDAARWMKLALKARGTEMFRVYIDGQNVGEKKEPSNGFELDKTVELEQGKHIILVKTIQSASDSPGKWNFDLKLACKVGTPEDFTISIDPVRYLSLKDIMNLPTSSSLSISADASLFALTISYHPDGAKKTERWIEVRKTSDGSLAASLKGIRGLSRVKWAPVGLKLSYTSSDKDRSSIYVYDLSTGETRAVAKDISKLGDYMWSPDGRFLVYSVGEEEKDKDKNVKRLRGISDRWSYGRVRSCLYIVSVPSGITRRLTAGRYSTNILDVRPDGGAVLITRNYESLEERPYSKTELVEVDILHSSTDLLWEGHWLNSAHYAPDGKRLLVIGGPSTFGTLGVNATEGSVPNDYDGQAYIFDIGTKKARPISRDFNPSIMKGVWSRADGRIYFVAEDSSFVRLFRYDPARKRYKRIKTGFDVVGMVGDISRNKPIAVLTGSSADEHQKIYLFDLKRGKRKEILDRNRDNFKHVKLGKVENWDFVSSSGRKIKGRVHYPPDFSHERKYPCIVYYYGGTSPTWRSFGGRYPKNLWAAMGYVVYVLQPSGATGFGQEFSSLHVNDWGKIVADEIIEGVEKFLASHPFVDGDRVGCIGASYGGFMTELLLTKTDIFAAAVSHAGISLIPHYWGEGYWGYAYNAVSAANSFPWNRRDIYVEQSPLFHADKIHTPLLLLHGTDDTNVPTGESDQMYVALKLLRRPVEYVQIKGQNHIINDIEKRKIWSKTILAWFDRWLKDQPEWWYSLYPDSREEPETPTDLPRCIDIPEDLSSLKATSVMKPDGEMILVGSVTKDEILAHLPGWGAEDMDYTPDGEVVAEIAGYLPEDISIICVLGTWCGDSKREVPRFWKVMNECGIAPDKLKMFAVDRSKAVSDGTTPQELLDWSKKVREHFDTRLVPTFIVCSGGKELGRIVESPDLSLEEDLLGILKNRK